MGRGIVLDVSSWSSLVIFFFVGIGALPEVYINIRE